MNLANVSIRRPVFATMLIAAFMVFGLISYKKIGVDLIPNVEFPFVIVTVMYPGTDPGTMERDVADKVEEAVNSLGGIRSLKSFNLESVTQVMIEFELDVKAEQAVQDVRDKVSRIQKDLPAGADPPIVEKFDPNSAPIMAVALSGDLPIRKLTHLADKVVKERLQRINGVGSVEIIGGRDREIQVYVDPDKLNGLGLTVDDIARTIAGQNLEIPAGTFKTGSREFTVKTKGQLVSADDVAKITLSPPGNPLSPPDPVNTQPTVRIGDVARVLDGVKEARSTSMLDGKLAVSLNVRKQSGVNTVAVAESVMREMEAMKPTLEREHAKLDLAMDSSGYIKRSIEDVGVDLILGAGLTVAVIFLFLINGRATLISAIALPTSVISTFAFVYWMNFTFNNMTMLALSLAIGVLVDDAIVVMENIHRHLEMGKSSMKAAEDATSEIFLAVVSMTSTILAVFVPVAIMKGIIGRFFLQFGLTVSFAVAMSLLVSFTLTPMMSSKLLTAHNANNWLSRAVDASMGWLERAYGKIIRFALARRGLTLTVAVLTLFASAALVMVTPKEFFPKEDRAQFNVNVELPTGTTLEVTNGFVQSIAEDLRKTAYGVRHTLASVGGGAQGQVNKGIIQVMMTRSTERKHSQDEVMRWIRERYAKTAPANVTVSEIGMFGGGATQPIQLSIRGKDLDELARVAGTLQTELKKVKGFADVDISYRGGKPEVALQIDRERAAALGVPVASIAMAVRSLMAGDAVSELKDGSDAYDIIVQLSENDRSRVESLSSLKVRNTKGQLVDLSNFVKVTRTTGPTVIEHSSRQRQVTLLANLEGLPQGDAQKIVDKLVKEKVPPHLETAYEGMGKVMIESFGYMVEALILAVILVYMILAAQFNSFIQPITIMVSLPLSVIGAFGALAMLQMNLSIYSMIGIIMLMGLVTKNAILIVDFANQAREQQNMEMHEALVQAGSLRLRPILMTTVSLLLGMLPVALALGEGGEARAPMAVCVMGGMIASTVLTLVIVPVVYTLFDALSHSRFVGFLGRKIFVANAPAAGHTEAASSS